MFRVLTDDSEYQYSTCLFKLQAYFSFYIMQNIFLWNMYRIYAIICA